MRGKRDKYLNNSMILTTILESVTLLRLNRTPFISSANEVGAVTRSRLHVEISCLKRLFTIGSSALLSTEMGSGGAGGGGGSVSVTDAFDTLCPLRT